MQLQHYFNSPHASAVEFVDLLLKDALSADASDIHLEHLEHCLRVRYRVDGVVHYCSEVSPDNAAYVVGRIKILSQVDSTERRIPQDGVFALSYQERTIDVRVSTFPSVYGENIVMRLLDRSTVIRSLAELGMSERDQSQFATLMQRPDGFFLVTGPTGSGKTTSLYAALSALNQQERHIVTLEDPVEYRIEGISQGHIKPETGFTFEKGIRAVLRHDPDVIMVGEIRDAQTATIALQAALTGQLVLSTVHTPDASSTIVRLMEMGIEPFLINAAISGVLAQRLVRTLCVECTVPDEPTDQERAVMQERNVTCDRLYRAQGCVACAHHGYKGRVGIFEFLLMTSQLRAVVARTTDRGAVHGAACEYGMRTLWQDGFEKVKNGVTSLAELMRVLA